jgi:prepilin-type N-terminal cleavage/methylation domain-containing protein/prepilin-type processing-associated H-X9-DG protein
MEVVVTARTARYHRPVRTSGRGFSLVELLVVIGIISVLMGILLPTVGSVRAHANQTKCASQLRQLGLALAVYANGHGGRLPMWGGWHVYPPGSSPEDEPGEAWTEQLTPFFVPPDSPVYNCPSFRAPLVTYFISGRWAAANRRRWMRLGEIRFAAQFVLAGETTNRHLYAPPDGTAQNRSTNDCDQDDALSPCALFPEDNGGFLAHRGGNNVLFGDLHVEAFRSFDPNRMTFDTRAMRAWADVPTTVAAAR